MRNTLVILIALLLVITAFTRASAPDDTVDIPAPNVLKYPHFSDNLQPLLEGLSFCGERVPMELYGVQERLHTQLMVLARNKVQVALWFKRRHRFFPLIADKLKSADMPEDLLFVPVIESSLQNRAVSSRSAVGPWQFIAGTARKYGLRIDRHYDERQDIQRATDAAIGYLRDLHEEFHSWPTALAAYNIGEGRIRREVYRQGTSDYYRMMLPDETDRYVFNIIAAKLIMTHPEQFDVDPGECTPYDDLKTAAVTLKLNRETPLAVVSHAAGMSYREFRSENAMFSGDVMPVGTHAIRIRSDTREGFETRINRYMELTRNIMQFRHAVRLKVSGEEGRMRIGPSTDYPVLRVLHEGDTFRVRYRTQDKVDGHYWYEFVTDTGGAGWIRDDEVDRVK